MPGRQLGGTDTVETSTHPPIDGIMLVDILRRRNSLEQCTSPDTNPLTDITPSVPLSTTSPEPWAPLPFQEGEKSQIQISETAAMDLDMRSCVFESDSVGHKLTLRY